MNPTSLEKDKTLLRLRLREIVSKMPPAARASKSSRITSKILKSPAYLRSKRVFLYVSMQQEVQTRELIAESLARGKEVYVPLIGKRPGFFSARRIRDMRKDLLPGSFGIAEPAAGSARIAASRLDYVLVPGLAFDKKGGRLGRGGGYFDRFLAKAMSAHKVGAAYREQILPKIPMEKHDIYMDDVITD